MDYVALAALIERILPEAGPPTLLHIREVKVFEVDFQSLDFLVVEDVPAFDRVAIGLIGALGSATECDLRSYVGLGREMSATTLARLQEEQLIEYVDTREAELHPTLAAHVDPPGEGDQGRYRLSPRGRDVLVQGRRERIRSQPVRLVLWAEPLHFLHLCGDGKFAPAKRLPPIPAEQVPQALQNIDDTLALKPEQREAAFGLGERLQRHEGVLIGRTPGSQWEVRPFDDRRASLLVVAGYLSDKRMRWVTFTGPEAQLKRCPRIQGQLLIPEPLRSDDAAAALASECGFEIVEPAVTLDGALRVSANAATIVSLLGARDIPTDVWNTCTEDPSGWQTALRTRAIPDDDDAAGVALAQLLVRRQSALRQNLESAIDVTWSILAAYWKDKPLDRPSTEWLLGELWQHHELRQIVCQARVSRDLIAPYGSAKDVSP